MMTNNLPLAVKHNKKAPSEIIELKGGGKWWRKENDNNSKNS